MTRRRVRIIAARRIHNGTAALWRTSTVRQKAATLSGAAIIVLKIAPHEPAIMAIATGAWIAAAWKAGNPDQPTPPLEPQPAPTSENPAQEGPDGGGGEGMTILETWYGTAHITPHPDEPHRTIVTNHDRKAS